MGDQISEGASQLDAVDPALFVRGGAGDPRLGEQVVAGPFEAGAAGTTSIALVGIADDRGVANSGGRVGAALGPKEVRRWLYKMTTGGGGELRNLRLFDLGDATPGLGDAAQAGGARSIEEVHAIAEESIRTALVAGARVVVLGGGHDGAFASHSALARSVALQTKVAAINIDARCDVRPLREGKLVTSGTQFRQLKDRWEDRYSLVEFGVQMQHNAEEHIAWAHAQGWPVLELRRLREDGVEKRFLRQLTRARATSDALAVSIDLDAVEAASAPGVSSPCPDGFSSGELLAFARAAGRESCVRVLDLMECAPPLDENGRTARLAAAAIWSFFAGACES